MALPSLNTFSPNTQIQSALVNTNFTNLRNRTDIAPVDIETTVTETDTVTGITNTWVDVTNLTVEVTVAKAAKILVIAEVNTQYSTAYYPNASEYARILESGGSVVVGREIEITHDSGTMERTQISLHGLYTAADAATYTFKVQIKKNDASANLTAEGGVITATAQET